MSCLRRSWLLSELGGPLDYVAREPSRLGELLALADEPLLRALAGRRGADLRAAYDTFDPARLQRGRGVETVCRHDPDYPRALLDGGAPPMLHVAGGAGRLAALTSAPTVALLGSTKASDYGIAVARALARGLAISGVTVLAALGDGISLAAHAGALEVSAGTLAVAGGGLTASRTTRTRALHERVTHAGCAVSELPCDCDGRRWGGLAAARVLARLASVSVLIEAEAAAAELVSVRVARSLGRTVAAVPGRVTSPLSRGPHTLLLDGAALVRGPRDVLELLYTGAAPRPRTARARMLEPRLRETLEAVGGGRDTPGRLAGAGADPAEVLLALSELELMGLLTRADGGRYVPCEVEEIG